MRVSPALLLPSVTAVASATAIALLTGIALHTGSVDAQRRRRPQGIPMEGTPVEWTLFVSPHGGTPAQRQTLSADAGVISLPERPYSCRYGAPNRVAISTENWSETRTLECQIGSTILSTNGFCQVSGASWGPRAAVLYVAEVGDTERVQVSLDCAVRAPTQ